MDRAPTPGSTVLLTWLSKHVYRQATEEVLGMRLKQFVALTYLRNREACSQQALCSSLMLDANNAVLLLNDLEDLGFVERRRDPEDRRRHLVVITKTGLKALLRAEAALDAIEGEIFVGLDDDERAELRRLLLKAVAGLRPVDREVAATSA